MENYEQKYKEALKVMESLYNVVKYQSKSDALLTIQTIEKAFPEFKESEDEKIRSFLIDFIRVCGWTEKKDQDWPLREECIAWLEKQGEQKSQGKSALEVWKDMRLEVYQQASGNRHEPNYSDDSTKMFSLTDIDEIFEKIAEKQGEQKTAEWNLPYGKNETAEKLIALAECLEMDGDCLFNGLSGNDYGKLLRVLAIELAQPKQEWSDEDEKSSDYHLIAELKHYIANTPEEQRKKDWDDLSVYAFSDDDEDKLNWIINVWNRLRRGGDAQTTPNQMEMLENWLKSIKDRMQSKPKQEWSKEDSERLLRIHQFIWANRKGDTDEIFQQEQDADWLMSIIPQPNQYDKGYENGYSAAKYNNWKPSEEQLEAFEHFVRSIGESGYISPYDNNTKLIYSLLNDLKNSLK